jgi:hypothetical protein
VSDQAPQRNLGDALEAALAERVGAARYERYQREVRNGMPDAVDRARPQEFDANGFPVMQRSRSFLERVARLLNPL